MKRLLYRWMCAVVITLFFTMIGLPMIGFVTSAAYVYVEYLKDQKAKKAKGSK